MDYSSKEGFLSKAKWIFSSLSGIILLWASKLPSPMQLTKPSHCCRLQFSGLKTLIYSQGHPLQNLNHIPLILTSHAISSSPPPSPLPSAAAAASLWSTTTSSSSTSSLFQSLSNSSSWCSAIDDFLGTESGVYMNSDYELEMTGDKSEGAYNRYPSKRSQRVGAMTKEYPPPLSNVPRVLTRHYENGNLVLTDEGMQQYFETTRENGRLIMNLVQLQDDRIAISDEITEKNNNEEMELELIEGIESIKEVLYDRVEYQESESDDDDDEEEEEDDLENYEARNYYEGSSNVMILAALRKMPESCLEDEEIIRKCFTYTKRRSLEWETNFGMPGSAPIAVTARPVTTVM